MSIEILAVGLEEETIELLAERIATKLNLNGFVTQSNPPPANSGRTQAADDAPPPPDEPPDDPWLDPPAEAGHPTDAAPASTSRGPASSAGQVSTSTIQPNRPAGGGNRERDKFGRTWEIGLADAPECFCAEPAARVHAKSQKGNWYTVWKCAKGSPSGDWRSRCEFSEFPERKSEQA